MTPDEIVATRCALRRKNAEMRTQIERREEKARMCDELLSLIGRADAVLHEIATLNPTDMQNEKAEALLREDVKAVLTAATHRRRMCESTQGVTDPSSTTTV